MIQDTRAYKALKKAEESGINIDDNDVTFAIVLNAYNRGKHTKPSRIKHNFRRALFVIKNEKNG